MNPDLLNALVHRQLMQNIGTDQERREAEEIFMHVLLKDRLSAISNAKSTEEASNICYDLNKGVVSIPNVSSKK